MIIVDDIQKSYGKKEILKGISFSVSPGEQVAIVGRNGCGKSTLMQIMAGVQKADHGSLQYYDKFPFKDKKVFRTLCGYVPQGNPLMEELTVQDNLKLFGAKKQDFSSPLLAPFELESMLHTPVSKLSGGMKRRVAIACAVYYMPGILFMDEPTTALDIYYKTTIHDWMKEYQKMGGILIVTTHDELEIEMCNRVLLMREGHMTELEGEGRSLSSIRNYILAQ